MLPSGYTALALELVAIHFKTQWCNGLLDLLERNPRLQHQRVLRSLKGLLTDMPSSPAGLFELTDHSLNAAPLPVLPKTYSGVTWRALHGFMPAEHVAMALWAAGAVAASLWGFTRPRMAAAEAFADQVGDGWSMADGAGHAAVAEDSAGSSLDIFLLAGWGMLTTVWRW